MRKCICTTTRWCHRPAWDRRLVWVLQCRRLHQALDYRTPAEVYGIKTTSGSGIGIGAGTAAIAPVGLRPPCDGKPWKRV